MFLLLWITVAVLGLSRTGRGLNHHARHERTRYVSGRNQIYGDEFDEKHIPFVHFWEKPLQMLESSMKIPKKLSSRPLFSWDLPVQMSTYTPSKKSSSPDDSIRAVTEPVSPSKEPKPPDADANFIPPLPKPAQKSRSDRAKASVAYPEAFGLIPTKTKKSGNWKKSIEDTEKWKEYAERKRNSIKTQPEGTTRRKKVRKNRKGKLEKSGRRRKTGGKAKEMNDQVNDLHRTPCETLQCEHRCREANGTGACVCFRGFAPEGERCVDINECETNNGGCNGRCVNTIGSRKCVCSPGFRLIDGVCADVNECLLRNGHGPCQDRCHNTPGSYFCACDNLPGTTLSSDKHACVESRTCNATSAGCSHTCVDLSGMAFCTCPDGMELGNDWKTCQDIDECLSPEDHDVACEFGCVNTLGSYACVPGGDGRSSE